MAIGKSLERLFNAIADNCQTLSWTIMRILAALMFMTHGWPKLFGDNAQPVLGGMDFFGIDLMVNMLWIAGVIEVFGGALLVLGLFSRLSAGLCALLMIMAYATAHPAWFPTLNNGELAAMYFVVFFVLFAFGPGKLSVDSLIRGQR
ncbi:DoxX family protein [Pseudohongiella sp. SYSU M77423]|uniref:DoxX family protein n=1 Tax=Pseudohongiella sp. SYSU M77423 TaxID=3042312 RepID=UPI00248135B0|nr:DoxX family protein [Pseudohongiella sp. SYSU M77423]MDH7943533.1 DoxX family protein [Pseudohongiella sp. SYSU M77423]